MGPEADSHLRVRTEIVQVRIFTAEFEIEGGAHTKPGGYSSRVSDILNLSRVSFLPITEARYRQRSEKPGDFVEAGCVIVKIENIELLDFV